MMRRAKCTVAQACLEQLVQQYVRACLALPEARPIPREADIASFACLHIIGRGPAVRVAEMGKLFASCRDIAGSSGHVAWLDTLVWDLCTERLGGRNTGKGSTTLIANLTHPNSGVRAHMMELAWFVRATLPLDDVAPLLLKNIADTLLYWDLALGLCAAMCPGDDAFLALAENHVFEDFEEQYAQRIAYVKEHGLAGALAPFRRLQVEVHEQIEEVAFGLYAERRGQ